MKTTMLWIALPATALAHDGHGLPGAHWHATDLWGFVALLAAIGALAWWSRKR